MDRAACVCVSVSVCVCVNTYIDTGGLTQAIRKAFRRRVKCGPALAQCGSVVVVVVLHTQWALASKCCD